MPVSESFEGSGDGVPRNIVLFDQYPYLGGGQVMLLSAIQAAVDVAARVTVVIPTGGALEKAIRRQFGVQVEIVGTSLPPLTHGKKSLWDGLLLGGWSIWLWFRHLPRVVQADLLYGNGPRQFPLLVIWSVLLRKRCCYHVHIDLGAFGKRLLALVSGQAMTHRIIVNSEFTQRGILGAIAKSERRAKVVLIENGLSPKYAGRQFVGRWLGRERRVEVLVPGAIRPEKGQDTAVDLASQFPEIRLHIVGRTGEGCGAWFDTLRASAPRNVAFHGPVDDLGAYIEENDIRIVLVPSRWEEPFGLVAIEGMAESCVTVVSARGALPAIAARTGALVYGSADAELVNHFRALVERPTAELEELARQQFIATMREFGAERLIVALRQVMR